MNISKETKETILAFYAAFEQLTGAWPTIESVMQEEWGIEDPDAAIERAMDELRG